MYFEVAAKENFPRFPRLARIIEGPLWRCHASAAFPDVHDTCRPPSSRGAHTHTPSRARRGSVMPLPGFLCWRGGRAQKGCWPGPRALLGEPTSRARVFPVGWRVESLPLEPRWEGPGSERGGGGGAVRQGELSSFSTGPVPASRRAPRSSLNGRSSRASERFPLVQLI